MRARQRGAQRALAGSFAGDDDPYPGLRAHLAQQGDVLPRRQPAHVADEQVAARGEFAAQPLVAVPGLEAPRVDAAGPEAYPRDAVRGEVRGRGEGRGEGTVRPAVHGAQPAPGQRGAAPR